MTSLALLAALGLLACGNGDAVAPGDADSKVGATLAGTGQTASSPAVRPVDQTFREWLGTCDNGNGCVVYTGSDNGGWLMVRQAAGPDAEPQILAGLSAFIGEDTVEGVQLNIDGQRQTLVAGPDDTMSYAVPADQVRTVLARLVLARTIMLGVGETQISLPTAGASAAFLWVDEKQGRLETTTALIRRGERAASAVPAAPALPRVLSTPAVDQNTFSLANDPGEQGGEANLTLPAALEALPDVKQCREDTRHNAYLQKAVLAGRLSADTELWGVPCDAGAYNSMYDFYLLGPNGADPQKVAFPTWAGETPEAQEGDIVGDGLVNPVFEARTNTITHFPRARGFGDCGTIQSWAWTGQAFTLTAEKTMGNCWGIYSDLWPTTWRTQ